MRFKMIVLVWALAVVLSACAPAATPGVKPSASPLTSPLPDPETGAWANAPQAALRARADLAERLRVPQNAIELASVEQVDWPDACLGIHLPDVMCAQVISPGYRVILQTKGTSYEYHTNLSGEVVRLVEQ